MGIDARCDIRHSGPYGIGLRFTNRAAVAPLIEHVFPMAAVTPEDAYEPPLTDHGNGPVSVRQLRKRLFGERHDLSKVKFANRDEVAFNRGARVLSRPSSSATTPTPFAGTAARVECRRKARLVRAGPSKSQGPEESPRSRPGSEDSQPESWQVPSPARRSCRILS